MAFSKKHDVRLALAHRLPEALVEQVEEVAFASSRTLCGVTTQM